MNGRRIADLHRELARVHAELAEALSDDVEVPDDAPSSARPRRAKIVASRKPRLMRPEGESDELAQKKAQRWLRQFGYSGKAER